jgi:hypothetical protein
MTPAEVHRDLKLTTPLTEGPDVKAHQKQLNEIAKQHKKIIHYHLREDGELGKRTLHATVRAGYVMGLTESRLDEIAKKDLIAKPVQVSLRHPGGRSDAQKKRAEKRREELRKEMEERLPSGKVVMFDSVTVDEIPGEAKAVAGYTSGNFPTFPELVKRFPHALKLSIAVTASHDADCLDVEAGDAAPEEAPAWVRRQKSGGSPHVRKPVVYSSLSQMPGILAKLAGAGIGRDEVLLWTAHYTDSPHVCTPACGLGFATNADATQWTKTALGRNLDQSLCSGSFFK